MFDEIHGNRVGCAFCNILGSPATNGARSDSLAIFGVVYRDCVPIEKIIHHSCEYHRSLMSQYYEMIVSMYEEDSGNKLEPSLGDKPVKPPPDKNSN